MNPADFTLQPPEVPQPTLLDVDLATHDWPLPPARPWAPPTRPFWLQVLKALARGAA